MAGNFSRQLNEQEEHLGFTARQKLESILRYHIQVWILQLDEVLVATHESKYLEEPWLSEFMQERRKYMRRIEKIIREGMEEGTIRNTDPYPIMLTFMSTVRGIEFWHRKKDLPAKALENGLVDMMLNGLIPPHTNHRG
jgi:hypothetical protein